MSVANRLHDERQIPASGLIRPYAIAPHAEAGKKREKAGVGGSRA